VKTRSLARADERFIPAFRRMFLRQMIRKKDVLVSLTLAAFAPAQPDQAGSATCSEPKSYTSGTRPYPQNPQNRARLRAMDARERHVARIVDRAGAADRL
jgi:hypothetical protein